MNIRVIVFAQTATMTVIMLVTVTYLQVHVFVMLVIMDQLVPCLDQLAYLVLLRYVKMGGTVQRKAKNAFAPLVIQEIIVRY